jgi:hypothetical protein
MSFFKTKVETFTKLVAPKESLKTAVFDEEDKLPPGVKLGVSFLPGREIKSIPIKLPDVGEFYKMDPQVGYFEVISINPTSKKVRIREVCTDNELEVTIRVFNYLLMKIEKYPMKDLISASKQRK